MPKAPSAPSAIDGRRLRDGATALEASIQAAETLDEVRRQLIAVHDGIATLQSLDDLGSEANAQAAHDEQELWKRLKMLERRRKQLEGNKETP